MKKYRSIAVVGSSLERVNSTKFSASNISSETVGTSIDPILGIDYFAIRGPIFPPHPHAGFSPITYLFEDGEGDFISRVSTGVVHSSKPGGVIWNISGSGLLHEEYPKVEGELSKGMQVLINLSSEHKMRKPEVLFVDGPNIPVYKEDGIKVRVVSGSVDGIKAKIHPPGDITFLDITLDPNRAFETELPVEDNVLIYIVEGSVLVGDEQTRLAALNAATLNYDGSAVSFKTVEEHVHIILISGKPLNEPIVKHGSVVEKSGGQSSFVMNTQEQIDEALKRFYTGEMGVLQAANHY